MRHGIHAYEVHAYEVHANKVHANEGTRREICSHDMHAYKV